MAEDTRLERKVALKFLSSESTSEEERIRFIREAQAASALDHPNICTIYEAGDTDEGKTFIAMAFCDGLTEGIIADLSHIHDLLVISRSSAMTFKGTKKKIKEIAREVNVQYVLEGSDGSQLLVYRSTPTGG